MSLFPQGRADVDNYTTLVLLLVERLGGSVILNQGEVDRMVSSPKRLYIEPLDGVAGVLLEVVPE